MDFERQIEELIKEIDGLKNQLHSCDDRINKASKVASQSFGQLGEIKKKTEDSELRIKNVGKAVGELRTTINEQSQEGGLGTSSASFDEGELKELMVNNIPYSAISTFINKKLKEAGIDGSNSNLSGKGGKKKKESKGFFKTILTFVFIAALFVGSYQFYNQKKIRIGLIKKGTEFYNYNTNSTHRLGNDKKVSGYIEVVNTKDGVKRFFISSEIKDGKNIKYKYFIK